MRSHFLFLCAAITFCFGSVFGQGQRFSETISCDGDYRHHLQGVCADDTGSVFWSFTTEMVKTDSKGKVLAKLEVENHHGDLCYTGGKVYVAVNLGKFNDPKGNADSWVYVYDSASLKFLSKHEVKDVFHGAGGMDARDGHFYIVGGLPKGVEKNYVYEYDEKFQFVKKHIVKSAWTNVGIQTADWHDGAWWFGCYGTPKILLKTDADFKMMGRYEFDASLGIFGTGPNQFLIAKGPRTPEKRCRGTLHPATSDAESGLKFIEAEK